MSKRLIIFILLSFFSNFLNASELRSEKKDKYLVVDNRGSGEYVIDLKSKEVNLISYEENELTKRFSWSEVKGVSKENQIYWKEHLTSNLDKVEKFVVYFGYNGEFLKRKKIDFFLDHILENGRLGISWNKNNFSIIDVDKNSSIATINIKTGYFGKKIMFNTKPIFLFESEDNTLFAYNHEDKSIREVLKLNDRMRVAQVSPDDRKLLLVGPDIIRVVDYETKSTLYEKRFVKELFGYSNLAGDPIWNASGTKIYFQHYNFWNFWANFLFSLGGGYSHNPDVSVLDLESGEVEFIVGSMGYNGMYLVTE